LESGLNQCKADSVVMANEMKDLQHLKEDVEAELSNT
jgi:hypothetical protein